MFWEASSVDFFNQIHLILIEIAAIGLLLLGIVRLFWQELRPMFGKKRRGSKSQASEDFEKHNS